MKIFKSLLTLNLLALLSLNALAQSDEPSSDVTPIGDIVSEGTDEEIVTIQGRITLVSDDDEIYVQDPTGKIAVELEDSHQKLKLRKGDEVLINGEVDINLILNTTKIEAIDIEKIK